MGLCGLQVLLVYDGYITAMKMETTIRGYIRGYKQVIGIRV